jgi:hypothetical protein
MSFTVPYKPRNDALELTIAQHKGVTLVVWRAKS